MALELAIIRIADRLLNSVISGRFHYESTLSVCVKTQNGEELHSAVPIPLRPEV